MENESLTSEMDLLEREEQCRKALKTVTKAIFMRLFVSAILVWAALQAGKELWIIGMMALVLVINLVGILPLWSEWKKQRRILKDIIAEYEV